MELSMKAKYVVVTINVFLAFLIMPAFCSATTYYVDATNGNDLNNGISQETPWKKIEKINNSKFNSGDQILFKKGEIWREMLNILSSGSKETPIIFGSYGTGVKPEIRGTLLLSSNWALYGTNIYFTTLYSTTEANQAWEMDVFLQNKRQRLSDLRAYGDWFHDMVNNKLYVYKNSIPTNVEVSQLARCISVVRQNYIKIENLKLTRSNSYGIQWMESNYLNLDGLEVTYCYCEGAIAYNPINPSNFITIQNSEIAFNGSSGILVNGENYDILIQNNVVHHNCRVQTDDDGHKWNAGIKIWGDSRADRAIIQYNHVYESLSDGLWARGAGIWVDEWGDDAIIRYNNIHNNALHGIWIEHTNGQKVYYNIVYNCGYSFDYGDGITVNRNCSNNEIYNNTVYNCNQSGISCTGSPTPLANDMTGNIFKNNISFGNKKFALKCERGGENDGFYGSGNIYEYNCFGPELNSFITWGVANTHISTYAEWEILYGKNSNSIKVIPNFMDENNFDFHLRSNSACIDAGIAVGLSRDYDNIPIYQGRSVEVGAFEYKTISSPKNFHTIP
jgi:parallel beta-helix repeat protein